MENGQGRLEIVQIDGLASCPIFRSWMVDAIQQVIQGLAQSPEQFDAEGRADLDPVGPACSRRPERMSYGLVRRDVRRIKLDRCKQSLGQQRLLHIKAPLDQCPGFLQRVYTDCTWSISPFDR